MMLTRRLPETMVVWEARVPVEVVGRAAAVLAMLGHPAPVEVARPGACVTTLALYLSPRTDTHQLTHAFKRFFAAPCRVRRRLLRGWQTRWKRSLRVQRLTPRLVLCPTTKRYRAACGELVIRLNPGLAFGSGSHATTRFVLRMLDRFGIGCESFLDLGTGSGILSIGAWLLGTRRITAVDCDPLAIEVSRANFRRNRVLNVRLLKRSVETWRDRGRYGFVAANLDTESVLRLRDQLVDWVKAGGVLCVTGIAAARREVVVAHYRLPSLRLIGRFRDRAWCGLCFKRA